MGTVDGLGFEEVNQTVTSTTRISGANIYGATSISGASIRGGNISTPGSFTDVDGGLHSLSLGSKTSTFGCRAQAGYVATSAGSAATITFGTNFGGTGWFAAFGVSGAVSAILPTISGVQNVSGGELIGAASTNYHYIALGRG